MESSPFDAAEKLLEITLRRGLPSLRALGDVAWAEIVEAGGGAILQPRHGDLIDSYVLSESSLFVWDRSMSLLTCGRTDLGRSFEAFVARVGAEAIEGVRLAREADRYPRAVRTSFEDDVARLACVVSGETLESPHGGASLRTFQSGRLEGGLEFRLFCAGLGEASRRAFLQDPDAAAASLSGLERLLPGAVVQRHHFEPSGFSMNLTRGAEALCVHVSPEDSADVASVEASTTSATMRLALLEEAERIFRADRISLTLDGRRLLGAEEARERLQLELGRRDDARVV